MTSEQDLNHCCRGCFQAIQLWWWPSRKYVYCDAQITTLRLNNDIFSCFLTQYNSHRTDKITTLICIKSAIPRETCMTLYTFMNLFHFALFLLKGLWLLWSGLWEQLPIYSFQFSVEVIFAEARTRTRIYQSHLGM